MASECVKRNINVDNLITRDYKRMSEIFEKLKNDLAFKILLDPDDQIIADIPLLAKYAIIATYCARYATHKYNYGLRLMLLVIMQFDKFIAGQFNKPSLIARQSIFKKCFIGI